MPCGCCVVVVASDGGAADEVDSTPSNVSRILPSNRASAVESVQNEINPNNKTIRLIYGGVSMDEKQKEKIVAISKDFLPAESEIKIEQGIKFDASVVEDDETKRLKAEINRLNQQLNHNEMVIDSITARDVLGQRILKEIQAIYPEIEACSYSKVPFFAGDSINGEIQNMVVFKVKNGQLNSTEKEKIRQWLSVKLNAEKMKIFYTN